MWFVVALPRDATAPRPLFREAQWPYNPEKRHPPPAPRLQTAAAPTQGVRRGRPGAAGQRRLRRPRWWGPWPARTPTAGLRTCGVIPSARRCADRRAASREGRPRRPSRWDGGTRSSKPGPVGFRRVKWRGPRSGPRRIAGHRTLPHGRSGPSATRAHYSSLGRQRCFAWPTEHHVMKTAAGCARVLLCTVTPQQQGYTELTPRLSRGTSPKRGSESRLPRCTDHGHFWVRSSGDTRTHD